MYLVQAMGVPLLVSSEGTHMGVAVHCCMSNKVATLYRIRMPVLLQVVIGEREGLGWDDRHDGDDG